MRPSRLWRYASSSTISLVTPSSLRISTSSRESDSWLAMALRVGVAVVVSSRARSSRSGLRALVVDRLGANVHVEVDGAHAVPRGLGGGNG